MQEYAAFGYIWVMRVWLAWCRHGFLSSLTVDCIETSWWPSLTWVSQLAHIAESCDVPGEMDPGSEGCRENSLFHVSWPATERCSHSRGGSLALVHRRDLSKIFQNYIRDFGTIWHLYSILGPSDRWDLLRVPLCSIACAAPYNLQSNSAGGCLLLSVCNCKPLCHFESLQEPVFQGESGPGASVSPREWFSFLNRWSRSFYIAHALHPGPELQISVP